MMQHQELHCWKQQALPCIFLYSGCKIHSFHPMSSFELNRICGMKLVGLTELAFEIVYLSLWLDPNPIPAEVSEHL